VIFILKLRAHLCTELFYVPELDLLNSIHIYLYGAFHNAYRFKAALQEKKIMFLQ